MNPKIAYSNYMQQQQHEILSDSFDFETLEQQLSTVGHKKRTNSHSHI